MKIGIVSDSHDHLEHLQFVADVFRNERVELVVHAGDFVSPSMILALSGLRVAAVFGNNDGEVLGLSKVFSKISGQIEGDFLEIETPEGLIALYHGTIRPIKEALILSHQYYAVICGHTHRIENRYDGKTRVLNPGTLHGFGGQASYMIYDTTQDDVRTLLLK
ncbi:MAG: YfcE family phosphodiesterase [Magnetococcales bacterium]|nr:YfcE family phosphodiesterase [Magnetococcales bacterium]